MAAGYLDMHGLPPEDKEAQRVAFVKGLISRIEKKPIQAEPIEVFAKPLIGISEEG